MGRPRKEKAATMMSIKFAEGDEEILEWLKKQSNKTLSIKLAIMNAISQFGMSNIQYTAFGRIEPKETLKENVPKIKEIIPEIKEKVTEIKENVPEVKTEVKPETKKKSLLKTYDVD